MQPPTHFVLPSWISSSEASIPAQPLLFFADTATQLVSFTLTFSQKLPTGSKAVLITSNDRETFASSLSSSLFTSLSSPHSSNASILASHNVTIFYVETLAQLRVLLSSLQHLRIAFLGVDSFISLHEPAAELSAQGISRTLAAIVNITVASKGFLALREPKEWADRSVQMLNARVTPGLSPATTPVIRILGRWVRGFWCQDTDGEGECSAEWNCQGEKWEIRWALYEGKINGVQMIKL